jgi:hypothetical protein
MCTLDAFSVPRADTWPGQRHLTSILDRQERPTNVRQNLSPLYYSQDVPAGPVTVVTLRLWPVK